MIDKELLDLGKEVIASIEEEVPFEQPRNGEVDGEVMLGAVRKTNALAGLDLKEINEHMLIAGRPGAGKTSLIYSLLTQLMEKDVPFWAFDFKNDYRHILNLCSHETKRDFFIFNPSTFRFNPLRPPEGVKPEAWVQVFINIFGFSFFILSGGSSVMVEQIHRLYNDYGVFKGSNRYPSVLDLYEALRQFKKSGYFARSSSRELGYFEGCYNRISQLAISLKDFLDCDKGFLPEKLLESNVVLELQGLINDNETFIANIILAYIYQYKISNGLRSGLKHVIVFDEAKKIFSAKKEFTEEFSSGPIAVFASQVREFGEGLIVADQIPSELGKSIRDNVYTRVCLSQSGGDSVTTMANDLMLSPEQAAFTQQLAVDTSQKIFEGIIRFPKYPYPFVIRMPIPDFSKSVTDTDVNAHMKQRWQSLARDLIPRTPLQYIREAQKEAQKKQEDAEKLKKAEERRAAEQPTEKPQEPPKPEEPKAEEKPVEGNELIRFLTHIKDKPFMDVTERYKELGYTSTAIANKVQNELIGKGFIEKVIVNRGYKKGNITLFQITPKGMEFARIDKIEIPGKGGLEHKYWQHIIREHYAKLGWHAVIEQNFAGKNVDVSLEKFKEDTWAVEIELTPENLIANVEKDSKAVDRILVCVKSEKAKKSYEEKLREIFDDETMKKVEFKVLGEFIDAK